MRQLLLVLSSLILSLILGCNGASSIVQLSPTTPLERGALGPFAASLVLVPRGERTLEEARAATEAEASGLAEYQVMDATRMGWLTLYLDAAQRADAEDARSKELAAFGAPSIQHFDAPVFIDNELPVGEGAVVYLVLAPLPWFRPRNLIEERMVGLVPRYTDLPGLSRKYFVLASRDRVGGIYLWEDGTVASAFYDEALASMRERYGTDPEVEHFEVLGVHAPPFSP